MHHMKMLADRHLWQICWVRDLAALAVVVLILWAAYVARSVTAPIVIGLALAYVLNPTVSWAHERCRLPRWAGAAIAIALAVLGFSGFLLWATPPLVRQVEQLLSKLPDYAKATVTGLDITLNVDWKQLPQQIQQSGAVSALSDHAGAVTTTLKHVYAVMFTVIQSVAAIVTYLPVAAIIVGFSFFFFVWHWTSILQWANQFLPHSTRTKTLDVLDKMDRTVAAFIRGRLIQALVMSVALSVGWWIVGVPYWLLLGILCGILNLVPLLAVLGLVVALVLVSVDQLAAMAAKDAVVNGTNVDLAAEESFRLIKLIGATIIYMIAQGLDSWVIEPVVQGKATNLDPLSVLLAVLIGGSLAGLLGMLLAIPAAACIKILAQQVIVPQLREHARTSS